MTPSTSPLPRAACSTRFIPAAVGARAIMGHFLPTVIFGAMAQAFPGRLQAASAGCLWAMQYTGFNRRGERFTNLFFLNGGQGASSDRDRHFVHQLSGQYFQYTD